MLFTHHDPVDGLADIQLPPSRDTRSVFILRNLGEEVDRDAGKDRKGDNEDESGENDPSAKTHIT